MKFKKEKKAVTIYDIVCHNIPKGTTVILKGVDSCDSDLYYVLTPNDGVKLIDKDDLKPLKPKKKKNKLENRVKELEEENTRIKNRLDDLEKFSPKDYECTDKELKKISDFPSEQVPNDVRIDLTPPETPNKKVINPTDNVTPQMYGFEKSPGKLSDIGDKGKTLEERLQELGCEVTKRTNTSKSGYDVWFCCGLGWSQVLILEGSNDEIVEKVKQIIEILK